MNATTLPRTPQRCTGGHFLHPGATACSCCGASARTRISLLKPPPPLPHHDTTKTCETAAGRAAMAAVGARIPVPVRAWIGHPDGTATAILRELGGERMLLGGIAVHYQPYSLRPIEIAVPCLGGAHHFRTVSNTADWTNARTAAAACTQMHADFTTWPTAAARDLTAAFAARTTPACARVIPLHTKGGQA